MGTWLSSVGRRSRSGRLAVLVTTAALAAGVAELAIPQQAHAATVSCDTPSLVSAINTANTTAGGGTVALSSGCTYTLTASNNSTDGPTGLPVITGNVTIQGNGATIARSSASGTPAFRLLDVGSGGTLAMSGVTVSGGLANNGTNGGGGVFSRGTLNVSGSTFTGNSAPSTSGTSGGAINSSGALTVTTSTFAANTGQEGGAIFNQSTSTTAQVTNSTFTNNKATIYGGGALLNAQGTMTVTGDTFTGNTGPGGGVLDNDATVNISNSTFTGNTGGGNGGGALENFGTITVAYSTLSGNSSPYGANIYNYTGYHLTIGTSIVDNPQQGANCGGSAPITDNQYNLESGNSCGFTAGKHSMTNTNPQLGSLADNGGPTQTMALPTSSPAVNAIPANGPGCTGSTDQRGTTRPQGSGCDMGSYELAAASGGGGGTAPSVPAGLTATQVTSNSVSLKWNASTGGSGVTGYTVYRNGAAVASPAGSGATSYTDVAVAPSTAYSYTVDAVDSSGTHSAQSAPLSVTTPASSGIVANGSGVVSAGGQTASTTVTIPGPVHAGDLLAGWFGQYNAAGQVKVSDNVNGTWTRAPASTTFGSGSGDIALFYVQNAASAPNGVTITVSAASSTYLEGTAADYSGVATSGALDQAVVGHGNSATVDSGSTAPVGAGELVVGGIITGGSPGSVTPGTTQGQPFAMRVQNSSGSADQEDVLSSSAGAQDARATFASATDWYAVGAVFHQAGSGGSGGTQPPSAPTGLTAPSVTATSVGLSWTGSTGAAGYTVYRNGSAIATTNSASYTDTTVAPSTAYTYTVDAVNTAGHSPQSTGVQVNTPAASTPPSAPTGLTASNVTATSVGLSWTASTGATGYTVYRNGTAIATPTGTSYTDTTVAPSTSYTYTVDAVNAGGHSAQTAGLPVTTPAASSSATPKYVQGGVVGTGSKVASVTLQFSGPVAAGDLLVGWFGQYDATGQVSVSDNVNGAWTRSSASTQFSGPKGDIALFYVQNAAAAPNGLTITIKGAAATYLQAVAAEYSGVATSGSLDQAVAASGSGTAASAGPTGSVGAGELVFSGMMTGTSPGSATVGGGLTLRSHTSTGSIDDADGLVTTAGPQTSSWTLSTAADWYAVTAVFKAG